MYPRAVPLPLPGARWCLCVLACSSLLSQGCGDSLFGAKDGDGDSGVVDPADADPLAPDADPNAPDADPNAPDADVVLSCEDSVPALPLGSSIDELLETGLNDYDGSCTNGLPDEEGVERIYKLVLDETADIEVEVEGMTGSPDLAVYILDDCVPGGDELLCADDPERVEIRDAPPGTYYVVVEGYDADELGTFRMDATVVEHLAVGQSCTPGDPNRRCETGSLCAGSGATTCQSATELLSVDFTLNLNPTSVGDADGDGLTWEFCNPGQGGCFGNETLSPSGGGYAIIDDGAFDPSDGEIIETPTINASGLDTVVLSFYQYNYNWFACNDATFIEVSTNGVNYTRIETQLELLQGYREFDISSQVAGQSFTARFVYDDETNGANCAAQYWHLDDIVVYGL